MFIFYLAILIKRINHYLAVNEIKKLNYWFNYFPLQYGSTYNNTKLLSLLKRLADIAVSLLLSIVLQIGGKTMIKKASSK